MNINKEEVFRKKEILDECKVYLKNEFIGIDAIIDNLMDYIAVWYLMPELLRRPVIINLWGMTGVGKTDLIRKLVKFLHFQERFLEMELSNKDSSSWENSVADIFDRNNLGDGLPGIVLFDEIQRFNTIDSNGEPEPQTKFIDFWELLSDGKLSQKYKERMENQFINLILRKKESDKHKITDVSHPNPDTDSFLTYYETLELKKYLRLPHSVEDLTEMNAEEITQLIYESKSKKKIYEPIDYSKILLIISGNLDEAFSMAQQTSEADVDADIFHAFTEKITFVDIKNALSKKFRPEQVSRFGNIHLIYNSLRKSDFETLIHKEISIRQNEILKEYGIHLQVTNSLERLIYRNGVFPVQGVRPVFSSITDILDSNFSKLLFIALMNHAKDLSIDYDESQNIIKAKIGDEFTEIPFIGRVDKIRQANEKDMLASISVHECGHAVAYVMLTGMVPLQLKSRVASSNAAGFTFPHQMHNSAEILIKKIQIYLAGGIAEELIFGKENASAGRQSDREEAMGLAADYIRTYNFDPNFQANYSIEHYPHRMTQQSTDGVIEQMMQDLVEKTRILLESKMDFLQALSRALAEKGSLNPPEIISIANDFHLSAVIQEEGFLYCNAYDLQLKNNK